MIKRFDFERDFVKYDPEFIGHLNRHIKGSGTVGSTFIGELQARDIVDYAYEKIKDKYRGQQIVLEVEAPFPIGLEGVIMLSKVPKHIEIGRVKRDGIHEVNIVRGIPKRKTRYLVIVAGPLKPEEEGKHGFLSIYPGRSCPPLEDTGFWKNWAFIDSEA
ncbi:hypothetical protein FJZ19_05195 [Candidatus Pacearchaeota archaeon]|nr:hypothetical protein [Candidatus Pacearchaeota archaeon]